MEAKWAPMRAKGGASPVTSAASPPASSSAFFPLLPPLPAFLGTAAAGVGVCSPGSIPSRQRWSSDSSPQLQG